MDDLSNKVVTVVDDGMSVELAIRLSRDFGKVNYFKPWKKSMPTFQSLAIGDGFESIHRVVNLFDTIKETDLYVFPYVYEGDLQLHLESLGKRVWGSRKADRFEYSRVLFQKTLEEVGLPVPEWHRIEGVENLRTFLEDRPDEKWIVKIERFRGDRETWCSEDIRLTRSILDQMTAYYGGLASVVIFVVVAYIETHIEIGYDGICIDGQFTDALVDYEIKNQACIASFTPYSEMHESVRLVNDAFAPKLAEQKYRSMWGTEIRIDKEGTPFFIDATCRAPSPPGEIMIEMIENLSEIIWHGAQGEFVQTVPVKKFGAQVMLYADWEDVQVLPIIIPKEIRQWVKLDSFCEIDGIYQCFQGYGDEHNPWIRGQVGAVVAVDDDLEKCVTDVIERAEMVQGLNIECTKDALIKALKEIKEGEEKGIEFSDDKTPEPAIVIEST